MSTEATAQEPPTKIQKIDDDGVEDWANHTLNIENALVKSEEGKRFSEIVNMNIQCLQGIGLSHEAILETMKITTVADLATYKYYKAASAIETLAEVEGQVRPAGSCMNVDNLVDKAYEVKSFTELLDSPLSALEGLTEKADETLKHIGIKTIGDLASSKYFKWAEAIVEVAKYEEQLTAKQRRVAREQEKLADFNDK